MRSSCSCASASFANGLDFSTANGVLSACAKSLNDALYRSFWRCCDSSNKFKSAFIVCNSTGYKPFISCISPDSIALISLSRRCSGRALQIKPIAINPAIAIPIINIQSTSVCLKPSISFTNASLRLSKIKRACSD